jgi:flagellin-like protein
LIDKKGISPLIATVLLIGFTIVLAALVFQWGGSLFKQVMGNTDTTIKAQTDAISKISISTPTIFYSNNQITKLIVNNEDLTYSLDGFDVQREWNDGSIETKTVMFPLGPGQGADITNSGANPINFSVKTTGQLKSIRVIPIFTVTSNSKSIQIRAEAKTSIVPSGDPRITITLLTPTCQGIINCDNILSNPDPTLCTNAGCVITCEIINHITGHCDNYNPCASPSTKQCSDLSQSDCAPAGCTWS